MPKEIQIRCDCGCNMVRLQSNNWIQAEITADSFKTWKWSDKRASRKATLFLATEECAHKLYSRWLASRIHKEVLGNENQDEVQVGKEDGRQEGPPPLVD